MDALVSRIFCNVCSKLYFLTFWTYNLYTYLNFFEKHIILSIWFIFQLLFTLGAAVQWVIWRSSHGSVVYTLKNVLQRNIWMNELYSGNSHSFTTLDSVTQSFSILDSALSVIQHFKQWHFQSFRISNSEKREVEWLDSKDKKIHKIRRSTKV